jgi:Peptidase inhibitor I9
LLIDLTSIAKLKPSSNKISYGMKKTFIAITLIMIPLLMVSQSSIVISSISIYGATEIDPDIIFVQNKKTTQEAQGNMQTIWLIAEDNATATIKNNMMNKTKLNVNKTISDQYVITLKDTVTRTPKDLEDALNNLTAKVQGEGAKVVYVYKYSIKGLAIKVPNQQILEKLLNDLRKDSMVAAIEPDKTVQAF